VAKLFVAEDIKRVLTGQASHYCRIKLLKEGVTGVRGTQAAFKAHKDCIREVYKEFVKGKVAELTIPTLPTPK